MPIPAGTPVTIGAYSFITSGRRILVAAGGPKDDRELAAITRAYQVLKSRHTRYSHPMHGEFKWCQNPNCGFAFYARRYKIEEGSGSYCCHRCFGAVAAMKGYRQGNKPDKVGRIKFLCLKCRAMLDRIPGSPATCPVCLATTVFLTTAAQLEGAVSPYIYQI